MLGKLLEKPLHTVGVPAGFACTIVMYNAATAYIDVAKLTRVTDIDVAKLTAVSNNEIAKLERMNAIAKESSRIRMEEQKRKMPWPIRLLY